MKTRTRMNLAHSIYAASKKNFLPKKHCRKSSTDDFYCYDSDASSENSTAPNSLQVTPDFKPKRRRSRKSKHQLLVLQKEFRLESEWTKHEVKRLSSITGLSESQVYKWAWDYRKKLRIEGKDLSVEMLVCNEKLLPSRLDQELYQIQRDYKFSMLNCNSSCTPSRFFAAAVVIA